MGDRLSSAADVLPRELVAERHAHGHTGARPIPPRLPGHKVVGDWPWHENPFVGTPEFGGLIVANLILTNWDWKTSNNKIYQLDKPVNGVTRWFMVRDLGALARQVHLSDVLKWFRLRGFGQGTRNDLPGFEQQGFHRSASTTAAVEFDYRGIYRDVISTVTPQHVRWTCERLSQLSDRAMERRVPQRRLHG